MKYNKIKWCTNCVLPNTRPNLIFDKFGQCNACSNSKFKNKINWKKRLVLFKKIIKKYQSKNNNYDCLIPVSGGKDSTWQVHQCIKLGLKPLAVSWKPPFRNYIGRKNLQNLINLGVDHLDWSISPRIEKKMTYKAIIKYGTPALPMHLAIHNIPLHIALKFKIPLIIWGDNGALEFGHKKKSHLGYKMTKSWRKSYGVTHQTNARSWVSSDLSLKDLYSYNAPKKNNVLEIFLGHFIKWHPEKVFKQVKKIGFTANKIPRTGIWKFADVDDDIISIHHWFKWYKFGFSRIHDNLSYEIRHGKTSRKKALSILSKTKIKPPIKDIKKLCKFLNITTKRFYKISEKFRNKKIWSKSTNNKWIIKNYIVKNYKF